METTKLKTPNHQSCMYRGVCPIRVLSNQYCDNFNIPENCYQNRTYKNITRLRMRVSVLEAKLKRQE